MHPLIIGAPFGNWLSWPGTTRTLGTFTHQRRGGLPYRLWRCLRTLRYQRRLGGWVNRLGLPNPGVRALVSVPDGAIVSIHGFDAPDWLRLVTALAATAGATWVEFNLSCPNVGHRPDAGEVLPAARLAARLGLAVIAKLPPYRWLDLAAPLHAEGVRAFHACNTLPTPGGGLSGRTLKPYSLWAVRDLKEKWGDGVRVIGGGGVAGLADVEDYLAAGADHVAIASLLLNPCKWPLVSRFRDRLILGKE